MMPAGCACFHSTSPRRSSALLKEVAVTTLLCRFPLPKFVRICFKFNFISVLLYSSNNAIEQTNAVNHEYEYSWSLCEPVDDCALLLILKTENGPGREKKVKWTLAPSDRARVCSLWRTKRNLVVWLTTPHRTPN
jgi:hypothetical protein